MSSLVQYCYAYAFAVLYFSTCDVDIPFQAAVTLLILFIIIATSILDLDFFNCHRFLQRSASDFSSHTFMSSAIESPQDSPVTDQSLIPWPEAREPKYTVPPNDWQLFPHPEELEFLPDGPQTPYELRQIVKRSLYKHELKPSQPCLIKPEAQAHQTQPDLASEPPLVGPENQSQNPSATSDSWTMSNPRGEVHSAAARDAASLIPKPLNVPGQKPRDLKPKSSFLVSKIERLGAKMEKLEFASIKRSSRNLEENKIVALAECAGCLDDLPKSDLTLLSCTHHYCTPCFTTLVTTAIQTESLFPPKCCLTEIPLKTVLSPLDPEQRNSYKQKAAEWSQPTEKRWYCPEPSCAKWIAPSKIHRSWSSSPKCPHCQTQICGMCRGLAHPLGTDCPQDFGLNAMLDVAEQEGWRRCYKCRSLVEKTSGCRHMTCTCKAQFCYTCGSKWKTCECTEVDQARREVELLERRRMHDTEATREEEEIARAIAEVEAAEQREARERIAAEERREEERRREEEELWRLEELRIFEEEQRKRDEEEAERQRMETIKSSIDERKASLAKMLSELVQVQQMALISRHESVEESIRADTEERRKWGKEDYQFKKQKLLANIEKRSKLLKRKHDTEAYATTSRHEEEEDNMFVQVQMRLRGKPNRETRERTMLESLTNSHKDELAHLFSRQAKEVAKFRDAAKLEASGLELGHVAQVEEDEKTKNAQIADLDRAITAERHWFEAVTCRRHALLEDLRRDQLSTMGESNLLDEWAALPFPAARPVSVVEIEQELVQRIAQAPVFGQQGLPTPPPSPDAAEKFCVVPATTDQITSAGPSPKPERPSLFVQTVMTENHTAKEASSQSTREVQSHISEQSGTTSTTTRLSFGLPMPHLPLPKTDKPKRWSFFGRGNAKEQMDEETFKSKLRQTVGDAF